MRLHHWNWWLLACSCGWDDSNRQGYCYSSCIPCLGGHRVQIYIGSNLKYLLCDLQLIYITLHSYKCSNTTADASSTWFTYECCQAWGTTNDRAKQSAVGEEKQRAARRMDHFDCHSRMHITIHTSGAVVKITHCQSHKLYVSINLPEEWHTFIENNHKMGPAMVCRWSETPLFQWNWMMFDSSGKKSSANPKVTR